MKKFIQNTVASPAAAYSSTQTMVKLEFMPPYFITMYHINAIITKVGVIVSLPAGFAIRDIDDVSIYLDKDATELGIQVKMNHFLTDLKFIDWMIAAISPNGMKMYSEDEMDHFKLNMPHSLQ